MIPLHVLKYVLINLLLCCYLTHGQNFHAFGTWYSGTVFINKTMVYYYNFTPSEERTKSLRVTVNSNNAPALKPILVVIKQERNVVSFQVPSTYDSRYFYRQVSRTLCPEAFEVSRKKITTQMISIELSSFIDSKQPSNFSMMTEVIEDFQLDYQGQKEIMVGTSEPQYYYFEYPKGIDSVVVRLSSEDDQCLIFSVQKAQCPIEDSIGNVMFSGIYQSVTTQGAITITSAQIPEKFVVVLVLRPSDYYCNGIETIQHLKSPLVTSELRRKPINLTIESTLDRESYVVPIVGAFLFYLMFYVAAGIIAYVYHTYDLKIKYNIAKFEEEPNDFQENEAENQSEKMNKYGTMTNSRHTDYSNGNDDLSQPLLYESIDGLASEVGNSNTKKRVTNKLFPDEEALNQPGTGSSSRLSEPEDDKKHHKSNSLTDFVFKSGITRNGPVMLTKKPRKPRQISERHAGNHGNHHFHHHHHLHKQHGRKGLFSSSSEENDDPQDHPPNHVSHPSYDHQEVCPYPEASVLNSDFSRYNQNSHLPSNDPGFLNHDTAHNPVGHGESSGFMDDEERDRYDPVIRPPTFRHDPPLDDDVESNKKELFNKMSMLKADRELQNYGTIFVSDLSKKRYTSLNRKYLLYFWYLIIVSIFYGLPVAQLVMTYQEAIHNTGNEDLCYYNFKCAHPLGIFTSFNNIVSNIGYIMLGILFLCLTFRRDIIQRRTNKSNKYYTQEEGIPQHYGLYYAMGAALLMEGLMSGCYHICPSFSNFQFDTAYMYILALILMLKIYQTRHPDVNASAHSAYMVMAMVILLGFSGVVYGGETFWIVFTIVFLIMSICLTAEIYYMGQWNFDICLPRRLYNLIRTDGLSCFRPMYRERMLLLLVANCVNCGLAAYGIFARPKDFSSYLLSLFLINLLMYSAFYIVMKLRHNEKILFLPLIYLTVASISWGFSLYFFINNSTTWQVTPAQSRAINRPCILFDFYDTHDVWHFLSSISMFFSFMALMNLDDDLINTPRDEIYVF